MANILILGVKVPYTRGGAESLCSSLASELKERGHNVDIVNLPISFSSKEKLLTYASMWRSIDFSEFAGKVVDLIIATKFPSYYAKHTKKSIWLVHQHRPAYELYGTRFSDLSDDPRDEALREALLEGDTKAIGEASYISGISENVIRRLKRFNGIEGEVLYPPLPLGKRYKRGESGDYILSVGRICNIKRIDLMIKALPIVHNFISLKVVGTPDEDGIMEYFNNEIDKHHLWDRVEFLGRVDDETLLELYANCLCVYYAPFDEDYGYVTLEAMASGKPVITAKDSGGVLEFVRDMETGLVLEPTTDSIGHGVNKLVENRELATKLGENGHLYIKGTPMFSGGWDSVISRLLSPLDE
ncbi:MAG: glycosyltransferase [Candidatus Dadabacteria bacterium]|nr:MAG: glycosyltransferase [Candidatus Dadabacteria bacterium]